MNASRIDERKLVDLRFHVEDSTSFLGGVN